MKTDTRCRLNPLLPFPCIFRDFVRLSRMSEVNIIIYFPLAVFQNDDNSLSICLPRSLITYSYHLSNGYLLFYILPFDSSNKIEPTEMNIFSKCERSRAFDFRKFEFGKILFAKTTRSSAWLPGENEYFRLMLST